MSTSEIIQTYRDPSFPLFYLMISYVSVTSVHIEILPISLEMECINI